jgi:hypothetical protein
MAEPQPSVETVIVKAKRAAQSLWMLLHAQVSHLKIIAIDMDLLCVLFISVFVKQPSTSRTF